MKKRFVDYLSNYHMKRRKHQFDKKGAVIRNIALHNFFHNMLLLVIKLLRKIRKQKFIIIGDKRKNTKGRIIYAITHIGGNDVEITFEAVKHPAWLFWEIRENCIITLMDLCCF